MEFHLIIWAIALELVVIWLNLIFLETILENYFFCFKEYKSSLKYFSNSKNTFEKLLTKNNVSRIYFKIKLFFRKKISVL